MLHHKKIGMEYLNVVKAKFAEMKRTAEKTFEQLHDNELCWCPNEQSNSIAIIVQHMSGNMISRWTDFLTTDGEKRDRDRDSEFEQHISSRDELYEVWNKGWDVFLKALHMLKADDLLRIVFIRGEAHTVIEAIERQMYHYSYQIEQIVYIAKQLKSNEWKTLTIAKKTNK